MVRPPRQSCHGKAPGQIVLIGTIATTGIAQETWKRAAESGEGTSDGKVYREVSFNRTIRTFVLPVHEIENYLLDSRSLRSSLFNNRGLSETDIQTIIEEAAGRLCWWAACREVVAELKRRFREPFVIDPPCTLNSQSAAKDHIAPARKIITNG